MSFKEKIWSIIGATGIVGLVSSSIYEHVTKKAGILSGLKSLFLGFISIVIPLWTAIVFVLALFLLLMLISFLREKQPRPWANFTSMDYEGWRFRWSYLMTDELGAIYPVCKICGCELSTNYNDFYGNSTRPGYLYCPDCNAQYRLLDDNTLNDVGKVIINKINRGGANAGN